MCQHYRIIMSRVLGRKLQLKLPACRLRGKIAQQSWTIGAGALRSVVAEIRTHDPDLTGIYFTISYRFYNG
jgi:hypothetical protein